MLPRQSILRAAFAALALFCAAADARAEPAEASLTIVSRAPVAEIRVRGVSLRSVRADDAQNTAAFDFNAPVSDAMFEKLADDLPDWIEMAYAGYDNAVIRAKRPVTFLTRTESDGFTLRIMARAESTPPAPPAPPALRGADDTAPPPDKTCDCHPLFYDTHAFRPVASIYARAATERPFDAILRGEYDAVRNGPSSVVLVDSDWRHSKNGTNYSAVVRARLDVSDGIKIVAELRDVLVNAKSTRQPGGLFAPFNTNDVSGSLGLAVPLESGGVTAEALYGRSGFGARIGVRGASDGILYGGRAAWHEPYVYTSEDIAYRAEMDYSSIFASGEIFDGLWAAGEVRATRYGIKGDQNVADTAAFHAGLRYTFDGWPLSLDYDADGEYLLHSHLYAGAPPTPFVPLAIRDREVHAFGGSFSDDWGSGLWFDAYGGYAIDRYANRGPYGGLGLRFTPAPGFDLTLGGRYSTVADREGGAINKVQAGLKLTYAWGAADAPIFHDNL